jgi:hypothetical protein
MTPLLTALGTMWAFRLTILACDMLLLLSLAPG